MLWDLDLPSHQAILVSRTLLQELKLPTQSANESKASKWLKKKVSKKLFLHTKIPQ
jgi:hypothetical protein